ncbi:pentatricopeptide repeat-containing protein At1g31920-like [Papaver somniferum]|nr:pentatricopeptide repeat-containing protein At1g31920-like [Papaver somniferum]
MIRTTVHQQHNLLIPQVKHPSRSLELNSCERECFSLLQSCKCMKDFKQVHAHILKLGTDARREGHLLTVCAISEWSSMDYACSIFRNISDPGVFEFNTMIRGYVKDTDTVEAILLYQEMHRKGVKPDNFTYPFLLKACSYLSAIKEGLQVHGHAYKFGFGSDLYVQNSLINLYGKCGEMQSCFKVFESMDQVNIASWSSLIGSHAKMGFWNESLRLFSEMNNEGLWRADKSTLVSVLSCCANLGSLDSGRSVHGFLLRNVSELNVIVQTSLIDMYVKCGSIEKGLFLFENMQRRNQLSYTVIISGLSVHGRAEEALKIFGDMLNEGLTPDEIVYVGVLSACSHGGLVDEGLKLFKKMRFEHQIVPTVEHYGCLVDLLARAGKIDEAVEFIKKMPKKPNDVIWRSLLSSCKVHEHLQTAETASEKLSELDPNNTSDSVLLSNTYAKAHRWEDLAKVRKSMADKGLSQIPGFSTVEVKRKLHKFVSQDKSHPKSNDIYEMIHQMEWQLKFEGYLPDLSQVLFDVDEEEKRDRLRAHSQKLAIAYALLYTSQESTIRVVKNLRMSRDCHTYTKLISKIFDRTIIVRDRNRFHHFKDGICSCKDYW